MSFSSTSTHSSIHCLSTITVILSAIYSDRSREIEGGSLLSKSLIMSALICGHDADILLRNNEMLTSWCTSISRRWQNMRYRSFLSTGEDLTCHTMVAEELRSMSGVYGNSVLMNLSHASDLLWAFDNFTQWVLPQVHLHLLMRSYIRIFAHIIDVVAVGEDGMALR